MGRVQPDLPTPEITVSIASYNTRDLLRNCLESLLERALAGEAVLQIVVVDNGSADGSVDMVRSEFPGVELLDSGSNLGYGRANNAAFKTARGRYFCALNSDAEMPPGSLAALRDFMDQHPQVGAVGPRLVYPDGRPQVSHGSDPTVKGIWEEQLFYGALWARLRALGRVAPSAEGPTLPNEAGDGVRGPVDQIVGACQFVRSAIFRDLGGYDPAYFMYHEDVDLNQRLRRAGWPVVYLPEVVVIHHLGASSQSRWQSRARMVSALNWSRYHSFHQEEGPAAARKLRAAFVVGAALRLAAWTFLTWRRPEALDRVRLFRVVLRRAVAMTPHRETTDSLSGI